MIDLGFTKVVVVAMIALVVLGPERLPKVARMLGALFGRVQRYLNHLKAEISHELELEVLRKVRDELTQTAATIQQQAQMSVMPLQENISTSSIPVARLNVPVIHRQQRKTSLRYQQRVLPKWFKQHTRLRAQILSGAARVHRYRPVNRRVTKSFF